MNFLANYLRKQELSTFFDYAAHTPLSHEVISYIQKMLPQYGNPSSIHSKGVAQKKIIEDARTRVAQLLKVSASEIIFTPGGTASINLALQGVIAAFSEAYPDVTPHMITSEVEHSAVRTTLRSLRDLDVITLTELPVNADGVVTAQQVKDALTPETVLVSIMYVNNEYGAVFPIPEIGKVIFNHKKESRNMYPLFHTDASQAILRYEIIPRSEHIDMMSFSSAKTYGPAHGGVLYAKRGIRLSEIIYGGGQEQKLWPGTQSVVDIAAAVYSFEDAYANRNHEVIRIAELSQYLRTQLNKTFFAQAGQLHISLPEDVVVSPYIIHGYVDGLSSERLLIELDSYGISISAQAACDSDKEGISESVKALWLARGNHIYDGERAVFRISLGKYSTKAGIDQLIQKLDVIAKKIILEKSLTI